MPWLNQLLALTKSKKRVLDESERQKQAELEQFLVRQRQAELEQILSVARKIAGIRPDALVEYVRLLGRKFQSINMCRCLTRTVEPKVETLKPEDIWFDQFSVVTPTGQTLYDIKRKLTAPRNIDLCRDLVLPTPWHLSRVATNLATIGESRARGSWKQVPADHNVECWLPFGVVWVHEGNHSIMTGIVQGTGTIQTEEVYDVSEIFNYVQCDGIAFIRICDGAALAPVGDLEFAAIFEVGRLMHRLGVSA